MASDRPVLLCDLSTVSCPIVKENVTPSECRQAAGEILLQSLSYARDKALNNQHSQTIRMAEKAG